MTIKNLPVEFYDQSFSGLPIYNVIDPSEDLRGQLVENAIVPNMPSNSLDGAIFSNCYLSPDLRLPPTAQVFRHIESFAVTQSNLRGTVKLPQTTYIDYENANYAEDPEDAGYAVTFRVSDSFNNSLLYRIPVGNSRNLSEYYTTGNPAHSEPFKKRYNLSSYRFKDIVFDGSHEQYVLTDPVLFLVGPLSSYKPLEELPISYERCTFKNFENSSKFLQASRVALYIIGTRIIKCLIWNCDVHRIFVGTHVTYDSRMISEVDGLTIEDCKVQERIRFLHAYVSNLTIKNCEISNEVLFSKCTVCNIDIEDNTQVRFMNCTTNDPNLSVKNSADVIYIGNGCEIEGFTNLHITKKVFDFDVSEAVLNGPQFLLHCEKVKNSKIKNSIFLLRDIRFQLDYVRSMDWNTRIPFFEDVDFEGSYIAFSVYGGFSSQLPKHIAKLSYSDMKEMDDYIDSYSEDVYAYYTTFKFCSFHKTTILRLGVGYRGETTPSFEHCDMRKCLVLEPKLKDMDWDATYIGKDRSTPIQNKDLSGIRMYAPWESLTFEDCDLSELIVDRHLNHGPKDWKVTECAFRNCKLDRLLVEKLAHFKECTFENCTFRETHGSSYIFFEDCTLKNCEFTDNSTSPVKIYLEDCEIVNTELQHLVNCRVFG